MATRIQYRPPSCKQRTSTWLGLIFYSRLLLETRVRFTQPGLINSCWCCCIRNKIKLLLLVLSLCCCGADKNNFSNNLFIIPGSSQLNSTWQAAPSRVECWQRSLISSFLFLVESLKRGLCEWSLSWLESKSRKKERVGKQALIWACFVQANFFQNNAN